MATRCCTGQSAGPVPAIRDDPRFGQPVSQRGRTKVFSPLRTRVAPRLWVDPKRSCRRSERLGSIGGQLPRHRVVAWLDRSTGLGPLRPDLLEPERVTRRQCLHPQHHRDGGSVEPPPDDLATLPPHDDVERDRPSLEVQRERCGAAISDAERHWHGLTRADPRWHREVQSHRVERQRGGEEGGLKHTRGRVEAPAADPRIGRRRPGDMLVSSERAKLALDVGEGTEHVRVSVTGAAPQDSIQLDVCAAGDGKHVRPAVPGARRR